MLMWDAILRRAVYVKSIFWQPLDPRAICDLVWAMYTNQGLHCGLTETGARRAGANAATAFREVWNM